MVDPRLLPVLAGRDRALRVIVYSLAALWQFSRRQVGEHRVDLRVIELLEKALPLILEVFPIE
jgi:hypothetical protein